MFFQFGFYHATTACSKTIHNPQKNPVIWVTFPRSYIKGVVEFCEKPGNAERLTKNLYCTCFGGDLESVSQKQVAPSGSLSKPTDIIQISSSLAWI